MGYLTPDTVPGTVTCRGLFIPNDEAYLAIVRGALQNLTFPENWDKFGALSQQEAANAFIDMFDRFCLEKDTCRMIGEIVTFAGADSPKPTWLVCDGSEVLIASYPDLYTVIGDTYGAASADHFRLPDLRGRVPAGNGTGEGLSPVAIGQKYGEEAHVLTEGELATHSHIDSGHTHTTGNSFTGAAVMPGEGPVLIPNPIPASTGSASANIGNTGSNDPHNTIGPRLGVLYLIVARDG